MSERKNAEAGTETETVIFPATTKRPQEKKPHNGTTPFFTFRRRNFGHWDIWDKDGRVFAIRGGPGHYYVRDERRDSNGNWLAKPGTPNFEAATVGMCCQHVCDILMFELLVAEGQDFEVIERWNVH